MKVSVITPTKDRPHLLKLCRQYVKRQTYPVHEHIIEKGGTQRENMLRALDRVTGEVITVFEDDDWYHPTWIESAMIRIRSGIDLFGATICYYHLPTGGYLELSRPSLCATVFRARLIRAIAEKWRGEKWLDVALWSQALPNVAYEEAVMHYPIAPPVLGMKGLPGVAGMGNGHHAGIYREFDETRLLLAGWVGEEDAARYLEMIDASQ